MTKIIIEGNSWMPQKRQTRIRRINRRLGILCCAVVLLCFFGGFLLISRGMNTVSYTMTEFAGFEQWDMDGQSVEVTISSADELALFGDFVSKNPDVGVQYCLNSDVKLPRNWTPVDLFDDFHGNGHTISNLDISGAKYGGLFRFVGNCTIDDLTLNGKVKAEVCGALAACAETGTVIRNCVNEAAVTATPKENARCFAGGLIGRAGDSFRSEASPEGAVRIIGCVNRAEVVCGKEAVYDSSCGGIVGAVDRLSSEPDGTLRLDIEDCTNYGKVGGTFASGGILGSIRIDNRLLREQKPDKTAALSRTGIMRCTNYGDIEHQKEYGNSKELLPRPIWAGGIAGCTNAVLAVSECSNYGAVNLANEKDNAIPGGILGGTFYDTENGNNDKTFGCASIYACANYGSSNAGYFGGMIGHNAGIAYLADSFTVGTDANGVCRALGDMTASEAGKKAERGGFIAYDVYNIVDASEIIDASLIADPTKLADPSGIKDPGLKSDPSLIVGDASKIEPWILRSLVTDTLLCYGELFPVYTNNPYKACTFTDDTGAEKQYASGVSSGSVVWNEDDLERMASQLTEEKEKLPLHDLKEHIYMTRSKPMVTGVSTPVYKDYDRSFFEDESFGDNAKYGEELKNNGLYWGVQYADGKEDKVVLGQKLSLTVSLDNSQFGGDAVVALMQKNDKGDFGFSYKTVYDSESGAFDAAGVLPGEYAVSVNGKIYPGAEVSVEENWRLPEAESGRFLNRRTLALYTVKYYLSAEDDAVKTEIVAAGERLTPPPDTVADSGYVVYGWNTRPNADETLDLSAGDLWKKLTAGQTPIRLYIVLGEKVPAHVNVFRDDEFDSGRTVTLRTKGAAPLELTLAEEPLRYEGASVPDAQYAVYVDGADTGVTLEVKNGCGCAEVYYYTVKFFLTENSDEPLQTVVVQEGREVTPPTDTYGETVVGWKKKTVDGSFAPFDLSSGITAPQTLYARSADPSAICVTVRRNGIAWADEDVTVSLIREGTAEIELLPREANGRQTEEPGTVYLPPEDETVPDGRYVICVKFGTKEINTGCTAEVKEHTAKTEVDFYTVTFYDDDGKTVLREAVVQKGKTVSEPADLKKAPDEWETIDEKTYDFSKPVNEELKLYAVRASSADGEPSDKDGGASADGKPSDKDGGAPADGKPSDKDDGASADDKLSEEDGGDAPDGESTPDGDTEDGKTDGTDDPDEKDEDSDEDTDEDTDEDEAEPEPVFYTVTSELENAELDGFEKVAPGKGYSAKIVPADGYMLPQSIKVVMNGEIKLLNVTYDAQTGEMEIPEMIICGDLTVSGSAVQILYYSIRSQITNSILFGAAADTKNGYTGMLVPNAGYKLPETITAAMNGEEFTRFTYSAATGEIQIPASAVAGNIVFSGSCAASIQPGKYQVIASVGHGKAELTSYSTANPLELTITPDTGYYLPKNLIVISGSRIFTDYTYDSNTGKLTVGSGKVGQLMVFGECSSAADIRVLDQKSHMQKR